MVAKPTPGETPFMDYYYILSVWPDAQMAVIEQAYSRLVRSGGSAEVGMDAVNEAYGVLASPELRRGYDQFRDVVLGKGVPPQPPQSEERRPRPPLKVMEKQHPKPRRETNVARRRRGLLSIGWWRRVLGVLVVVALVMEATLIFVPQVA